jgi:hypothetical protein
MRPDTPTAPLRLLGPTLCAQWVRAGAPPRGSLVLNVSCIPGGCGIQPIGISVLLFDSSNFSRARTVLLGDTGFKGRGQSIFQISGGDLEPAFVLVIRD